jgi:hypothetical protein
LTKADPLGSFELSQCPIDFPVDCYFVSNEAIVVHVRVTRDRATKPVLPHNVHYVHDVHAPCHLIRLLRQVGSQVAAEPPAHQTDSISHMYMS